MSNYSELATYLLGQEGLMIYIILFLSLMGGAVGLPIPEDLPLILAGVMVQTGAAKLEYAFLVCYFGIIIGDIIVYLIGRILGPSVFNRRWVKNKLPKTKLNTLKIRLEKRSLIMIFIARHLFYLRSVTFLLCGAVKMRLLRFIICDATAALISVPLMLTIGYFAAEHYQTAIRYIREIIIIITIVLMIVAIWIWKKKKKTNISDA